MNPFPAAFESDLSTGPKPRPPRLAAVDLARGLAVLFMIAVHVLLVHGDTALQSSLVGTIVQFLGGPPAAPVFMLLMGLSWAYSGKDDPGRTMKRGLLVLASGYALNILRGVLPLLVLGWLAPTAAEGILPPGVGLLDVFLIGDILQFAGLALITLALIRRWRIGSGTILVIAAGIAGIAPFLWGLRSGFAPLDLVLDLLWGDRLLPPPMENAVSFPVFPWLVFPLAGMVLGDRLRNAADPKSGIRRAGLVGLALLVLGLGISFTDPEWHFNDYYHARWGSMIFMVGFVLAWLAACDLVVRGMPDNPAFRFLAFCSKRVTAIYFLQWILINWAIAILGESSLGIGAAAALFAAVTLLSCAGAAFLSRRRSTGATAVRPDREGSAGFPMRLRDAFPAGAGRNDAVDVFVRAFHHDPLHAYLFPKKAARREQLTALYEYQLDIHGESCFITSPALEGVAIWEGPGRDRSHFSLREILRGIELIFRCGPRAVFRMLRYQAWSTRLRLAAVREAHWYLRSVVVDPKYQGKGFAGSLIKPFLAAARESGQKVYLETHNPANVALYERYDFKRIQSLTFGSAELIHHCMVLDPASDGSGARTGRGEHRQ